MPDLYSYWGQDLDVDTRGDLRSVDGTERGQQRIIRRLMTILGEYVWHIDYGASVPQRIGDTLDKALIEAVIREQISLEEAVAKDPEPTIIVAPILNGVFVRILYTDSATGQQLELAFDVSP